MSGHNAVCAICGSSEYKIIFKKKEAQNHQIVKCKECGLMYAHTIKDSSAWKSGVLQRRIDKDYVKKQYNQIADYKKINSFIDKIKPGKGKLLEVGANAGVFLNYLKESGWDTTGVDPAPEYVKYARSHFNVNMVQKKLETCTFANNTFDVAIMLHVIEHLYNPAVALKILNRILKHKGLLVIETPKYDTALFKVLGRRERSISCGSHLYFFTSDSLRKLVEKCGFVIVKEEVVGRTLSISRLLWNIGVVSKSKFIEKNLMKFSNLFHFEKVIIHLNMRDMQRIYCVKKSAFD